MSPRPRKTTSPAAPEPVTPGAKRRTRKPRAISRKARLELQVAAKQRVHDNQQQLGEIGQKLADLRDHKNKIERAIREDQALILQAVDEDIQLDLFDAAQ